MSGIIIAEQTCDQFDYHPGVIRECCSECSDLSVMKLASTRENLSSVVFKQQRRRPACAYVQSGQRLCYSLSGKYRI